MKVPEKLTHYITPASWDGKVASLENIPSNANQIVSTSSRWTRPQLAIPWPNRYLTGPNGPDGQYFFQPASIFLPFRRSEPSTSAARKHNCIAQGYWLTKQASWRHEPSCRITAQWRMYNETIPATAKNSIGKTVNCYSINNGLNVYDWI